VNTLKLTVGCFEVELIQTQPEPKWAIQNTLTGVGHRSYGTKEEIVEQLTIQSAIWERKQLEKDKKVKRPKGHAWRVAIVDETRKAATKKAG